jgi:hypothetical protein
MTEIDESKLIFFTGAPGSKWSAIAHLIAQNKKYPINTSDYSPERVYYHNNVGISHLGAYWGPGNGIGENFHKLNDLSKEEILYEIDQPYADKSWKKYRIIKCHQFSINLNFIKEKFPNSKIITVLRPDIHCVHGWLGAGGFEKITYPSYEKYYKNKEILKEKIKEENNFIKEFIHNNNLYLHVVRENYWKDFWDLNRTTEEIDRYMKSIELRQTLTSKTWNFDTLIAHYNF